jgi:hypothetical protein
MRIYQKMTHLASTSCCSVEGVTTGYYASPDAALAMKIYCIVCIAPSPTRVLGKRSQICVVGHCEWHLNWQPLAQNGTKRHIMPTHVG